MSKKKSAKEAAVEVALESAANQEPSPLEFVETDFTEVAKEETETAEFAQEEAGEETTVESVVTTASESLDDVRPNDTLFVQIKPDLFVRGVVVAVPGESECWGLRIKALRNNVYAVHPSRISKSAEDDNVVRRLRLSPRALKAWLVPA